MSEKRTDMAAYSDELFSVDPWTCMAERLGFRDNRKTVYCAIHQETGETIDLDVSPYQRLTPETFRRLIALGFPGRTGTHPLTADQIELMWWREFGIKPEEAAA